MQHSNCSACISSFNPHNNQKGDRLVQTRLPLTERLRNLLSFTPLGRGRAWIPTPAFIPKSMLLPSHHIFPNQNGTQDNGNRHHFWAPAVCQVLSATFHKHRLTWSSQRPFISQRRKLRHSPSPTCPRQYDQWQAKLRFTPDLLNALTPGSLHLLPAR